MRVAFLVTHLSGTGHLVRTLALARAVAEAGGSPLVISGGRALGHVDLGGISVVQLPPLIVEGLDYATPLGPDGAPATPGLMAERRSAIEAALRDFRPDALVTETYPLGRRRLADEFEAAIAAAGPRAVLFASVRDVPEPPSSPERLAAAAARIEAGYSAVLVHGDAEFLQLRESWPLPLPAAARVRHTGYVGHAERIGSAKAQFVLVSGGGGALGEGLLRIAGQAGARTARAWHLMVGGPEPGARAATFAAVAPEVEVHALRRDYRRLLAAAACSVSHAGYNTVMDLAACTTPAVIVPFAERGEREQSIRAARLAGVRGITVLEAEGLEPDRLARAVETAAKGPPRVRLPVALDGAERTAALIAETLEARLGA